MSLSVSYRRIAPCFAAAAAAALPKTICTIVSYCHFQQRKTAEHKSILEGSVSPSQRFPAASHLANHAKYSCHHSRATSSGNNSCHGQALCRYARSFFLASRAISGTWDFYVMGSLTRSGKRSEACCRLTTAEASWSAENHELLPGLAGFQRASCPTHSFAK